MLQAVNEGMREALLGDDSVFVIGEDIGRHGGSFQATVNLQTEFGERRVIDAPISEAAIVGLAVGAAMTGLRPIVDLMFADFMYLAMDQLANQAAKVRYMSDGQVEVPLVLRAAQGAGRSNAAQHSQVLHAMVANIPGLKVVLPATPEDAKGLLLTAVRDPNPVVFLEDKMEYGRKSDVPEGAYEIPFGAARIHRAGADVTVVATSSMVYVALDAAERLAGQGIEAEVVDPRTIVPLDMETILGSVRRTGRCVVLDEGPRSFGAGAEISARVAEEAFDALRAPVRRLGALDVPAPFNAALERSTIPGVDVVVAQIRELCS